MRASSKAELRERECNSSFFTIHGMSRSTTIRSAGAPGASVPASRPSSFAGVVLIALDQMSIGGDIVRETFLIILAGVVFALALAFGLGGREWAAEFLERWWPRRKR